jgi:hypothetical protein
MPTEIGSATFATCAMCVFERESDALPDHQSIAVRGHHHGSFGGGQAQSRLWCALIVSLPLISILAMIWLWRDTGDNERIAALQVQFS